METSQLSTISLLRAPFAMELDDPVQAWREAVEALVRPEAPHLFKAVAFSKLQVCTEASFPEAEILPPRLLRYSNALWIRGSGAIYDGKTGLALPGSFLTRFPRCLQAPACSTFRHVLERPVSALPRLEQACYVPFALCGNFGHFVTETLGFLWPLFGEVRRDLLGLPVLLTACNADDPAAQVLHALVRSARAFPVLEMDLPDAVHLEQVVIPEPSLRLHASCSPTYLHTAEAVADWLIEFEEVDLLGVPIGEKLYISRSGLGPEVRTVDQESALEALLEARGWTIFRPEQHSLGVQVAVYRKARVVAAFEGSALHGLAFLGKSLHPPGVVMLGDQPSPDYFLQFRAQGVPGFFIQCTRVDPHSDRPDWVRPRLLNGSVETLAAMLESLAAAF